jgi:hypothetical protein
MQSSLIANDGFAEDIPQPASGPSSTTPSYSYPVVAVIAPESLGEGYTFDVEVNHAILTVVVVSYPTAAFIDLKGFSVSVFSFHLSLPWFISLKHYALLFYTILCNTILYYTILYYTILYYTLLLA